MPLVARSGNAGGIVEGAECVTVDGIPVLTEDGMPVLTDEGIPVLTEDGMPVLTEEGIPALELLLDGGKPPEKAVFSPAGVELACLAIALLPGNAVGFP